MDAASGDSWAVSAASRTPSASQSNKGANPDGGGNYSSFAARQSAPERFGDAQSAVLRGTTCKKEEIRRAVTHITVERHELM
jgi:hypothetical protein